jgi:hypothetical protein
LRGTTADTVSSRDIAGLARVLRTRYLAWTGGERPQALAREERFTRRYQANRLLAVLAPLVGRKPAVESACAP